MRSLSPAVRKRQSAVVHDVIFRVLLHVLAIAEIGVIVRHGADDNGLRHGIGVAEFCRCGKARQQDTDVDVHHKVNLVLRLVDTRRRERIFKMRARRADRLHPHADQRPAPRQKRRAEQRADRHGEFLRRHLGELFEHLVDDGGLQTVELRHVALDRRDLSLVVLFKGDELVVIYAAAVDRLVHGGGHDAVDRI